MPPKDDVVVLQNWFVRDRHMDDFYSAPECNYKVLAGDVYGHPRFPNGHSVKTSRLISVKGRLVTTSGGTTYQLRRIQEGYRDWLRKEGITYDPNHPVTLKDK
jgi:hypothetical protein